MPSTRKFGIRLVNKLPGPITMTSAASIESIAGPYAGGDSGSSDHVRHRGRAHGDVGLTRDGPAETILGVEDDVLER